MLSDSPSCAEHGQHGQREAFAENSAQDVHYIVLVQNTFIHIPIPISMRLEPSSSTVRKLHGEVCAQSGWFLNSGTCRITLV